MHWGFDYATVPNMEVDPGLNPAAAALAAASVSSVYENSVPYCRPNPSFGWVVVAAAGWGGAWRVWAGLGLV